VLSKCHTGLPAMAVQKHQHALANEEQQGHIE
jgi:hypothetical protein